MTRWIFVVASVLVGLSAARGGAFVRDSSAGRQLAASVDPRVELLCIIFRLAGNPEYNDQAQSPYSAEVDKHFAPFKDHAVIALARRLRAERGIGYDAVTSMAVHLTDTTALGEKSPFDASPTRLEARWQPAEAREFLGLARAFVKASNFNEFANSHRALYEAAGSRMTETLQRRAYLDWLDGFFGPRPQATYGVIVSLLDGPHGRGVGVVHPDGREEILAVMGVTQFDAQGIPVIGEGVGPWVVHEFCHSYVNPVVDRHAATLQGAGTRIYGHCQKVMTDQAYGTWTIMMYESLVRAAVVRHLLAVDGRSAAEQQAKDDQGRGFEWIADLARLLGEYESNRQTYPAFDAFMPRIVEFFDSYAAQQERNLANAPHVLNIVPANGASDVDPGLTEMKVTFDRPMKDRSWSVVGDPSTTPKITGGPSYDAQRQVLTMSIALEPGKSYTLWLNQGSKRGFVSAEGVPLEPLKVTFQTRK